MEATHEGSMHMAATPAEIKQQVLALIEQLPPAADWMQLLHEVELANDRASGLLAQELDPASPLRQALGRALAESEAGLGIEHEVIRSRFLAR
jgi:hypothetical protein